jgi:DNA-binding LacI/PurR family transcriptional regulator
VAKNGKLTLAGLAQLAGVSTSTASRALNDNPLIKKETRERLQELAAEHNFSLNKAASRLRTQKTNVVAVILNLTDTTEQSISDPFLLKVVGDLNQALNACGYEMLLSNSLMAKDNWNNYFIRSQRADGLIVVGQGKSTANIEQAQEEGAPIVVWGDPTTKADYPIVGSDNALGGYLATQKLISAGAKNIMFLGDPEHAEMAQRYVGYKKALQEHDMPFKSQLTLSIDITSQAAYGQLNEYILSNGLEFDGIFAASDMVALGAMKALKERYINVPGDVSLVGFDDISMAELFHPALTTIAQNTREAAHLMVRNLMQRLAGKTVKSEMMDIQLIERNSTR